MIHRIKHLFKRAGIIAGFFMVSTACAYDGSPTQQIDQFFEDVRKDNPDAVTHLYAQNAYIRNKEEGLVFLQDSIKGLPAQYGRYLGYEIIADDMLSNSLVRISVLAKYQHHGITWEFFFYKPEKVWFPAQSTFVDQFQNVGVRK